MNRLFTMFAHDRGPAKVHRVLPVAALREWPPLWAVDPRLVPLLGDAGGRVRYFGAVDPAYPNVPLLSAPAAPAPPDTGIRDKFWQRLVVEAAGHLPQPGFAAVTGSRVEAANAPWSVRVDALDCRPVRAELLGAVVSGVVVAVLEPDIGFVAVVRGDGIHVTSRNPRFAAEKPLSREKWARFVDVLCAEPLPLGATLTAFNPAAELGEALRSAPGSYILKPRFGSNGVGVVRVVSVPDGSLTVESDCPDTALYLDEFPRDANLRGADVVAAATHRARFIDRSLAGIPEQFLDRSILEAEIPAHRAAGSVFEPRVVVQRAGASFVTLGAICKRIDTSVGAVVARDFREEPLAESLHHFLRERVPPGDLPHQIERARAELLTACDRLRELVGPLLEARGARVHQFGIDCRLCWDAPAGRAEFGFLEFQFGIGRIDVPLAGYKTRAELAHEFGPEVS